MNVSALVGTTVLATTFGTIRTDDGLLESISTLLSFDY
jgi:hypothetical protein